MTYLEPLVFYSFAGIMLLAAMAVIGLRNPVQSALSLVLCFFATAILWLTLHAEFLALILVLVYVGAVMTLFLFVIMMLDLDKVMLQRSFAKYLPIGILLTVVLAGVIVYSLLAGGNSAIISPTTVAVSNTKELGLILYTQYGYAFELAAVLLLIAIIAAISLAFAGKKPRGKKQDPTEQMKVNRQNRVRLVKMAAEKKN